MGISTIFQAEAASYLSKLSENYRQQSGRSLTFQDQTPGAQNDKDTVTLSPEGQNLALKRSSTENDSHTNPGTNGTENLDAKELLQLQELRQRDIEVRTHEQAHLSAAGQYARTGASFTYAKGPDGVSYAVGGEVGIDIGKESTPEATISKMETVKRAALAPASPSPADRSIAAHASAMEAQARQEILVQRQEELLHANTSENPIIGTKLSDKASKSNVSAAFLTQNTRQTMIAAYQRLTNK